MSEIPVVLIRGFATIGSAYQEEIDKLKGSGKRVFCFGPWGTITEKVATIYQRLTSLGVEKADFVGFSQGAPTAAMFASQYPLMVNRLVVVVPAGVVWGDTTLNLVRRFLRQIARETVVLIDRIIHRDIERRTLQILIKTGLGFARYCCLRNPINLYKEIAEIAQIDIVQPISRARQHNIKEVLLLSAHSDIVFQERDIEALFKRYPFLFNWASFAERGASHNIISFRNTGVLAQVLKGE